MNGKGIGKPRAGAWARQEEGDRLRRLAKTLPTTNHGPSVWPRCLRWLGMAVCAVRGHRKARSYTIVDGIALAVYCGRCRAFLFTAST